MIANNKSTISPSRQISKKLSSKMKMKNLKRQKGKVSKRNGPQLKSNEHRKPSKHQDED